MCEELQLLFWRTIFQVPKSTPKVMLRAETKSMQLNQRIWMQKLQLARNIMRKENSLASAAREKLAWALKGGRRYM